MKRFKATKFYHQFAITPTIGIKRFYEDPFTEHIALVFMWLNRGFHIVIFTKNYVEDEE